MDFTNLVIAPLAAIITTFVVFMSVLIRRGSEDRALLPAFVASILLAGLILEPWGYLNRRAFVEGMEALSIFGTIGFCVGALFSLVIVKSLRFARKCFLRAP